MIVLDTHAWIWWLSEPRQLGRLARRRIEAASRIGIPAICCLEVATLAARERIVLDRPTLHWLNDALAQPRVELLDLTPAIAVVAERLEAAELRFGAPQLVRPRLGQGIFRVAVTDAYARACAVTGEHSLPALEAAHIRPYRLEGPHDVSNGLLLRADLHRLFDQGYLTVTPDLRPRVGRRLREDYENGRSYPLDSVRLGTPQSRAELPAREHLAWHNERVFRG